MVKKHQNVTVIGGGTGTYTTLLGLKKYPLNLSVIVSMTDSGGSNRIVRDEFGLLPTSDLRQVMVALASEDVDMLFRQLFTYRYHQGTGINGMTFGNLFMCALTDILGNQEKAIEETCRLLGVQGKIIPVTFDNSQLIARYSNGKQLLGEHYIDEPPAEFANHRIVEINTIPEAQVNPQAVSAIMAADAIILSPGDLYTSLLSNIVVTGTRYALLRTKAKLIFVVNLMTKFGQTDNFTAQNFVEEVAKYMGRYPTHVLVNKSKKLNKEITHRYAEEKAQPVIDDLDDAWAAKKDISIIRRDLVSGTIYQKSEGDVLVRSLIRHDPHKIARAIYQILNGKV